MQYNMHTYHIELGAVDSFLHSNVYIYIHVDTDITFLILVISPKLRVARFT